MRERKPVIGVTCNFDYRDAVGMVSGMGITGQDWDFVSGDYVYILEKAGAIPPADMMWDRNGMGRFRKDIAEQSCPCGMSKILRFPDILCWKRKSRSSGSAVAFRS